MRDIALMIVIVIFGTKALSRPDIGLYLFSWLALMNPHRLCYGFATTFPVAMVTALVTIFGVVSSKEPKKIPPNLPTILLLIFLVWTFITTLFALNPEPGWREFNQFWKVILMTVLMIVVLVTKERIINMVWVVALSVGYYGFKGGLFTIRTGGSGRVWGPEGTFLGGNNEIGLALIMIIPLLRYLQLNTDSKIIKNALTIGMLLCILCVMGTQSRGALIGSAAMLLFMLLKTRNKLPMLLLLLVTVPPILSFMPDTWWNRMNTIKTYKSDGSAMGRINAWRTAINIAEKRVVGGGFKCLQSYAVFYTYSPDPENLHDAHSIYFQNLAEHGLIGLSLFLGIGFSAWLLASKTMKLARNNAELKWVSDLCSMLQVSLVGYASSGAFLGLATFDLAYDIVALIIVCNTYVLNFLKSTATNNSRVSDDAGKVKTSTSFVRPTIAQNM